MADMRGRPFGYLGLILCLWAASRWTTYQTPETRTPGSPPPSPLHAAGIRQDASFTADPISHYRVARKVTTPHRERNPSYFSNQIGLPPALDPRQDGGRPSGLLTSQRLVHDYSKPPSTGRDTPPTNALAPAEKAGTPPLLRHMPVNIYAYSFWRLSSPNTSGLAPAAQYGGSQSGIILTYSPWKPDSGAPALLLRASATPDRTERELAFGLRWKPEKSWPISLTAEQRLRGNAPDTIALYLAGGIDALPVKTGWRVDAFGQAGYVSGAGGGGFFDIQARLLHNVTQKGNTLISAGVGSWAGGQKNAGRLDIGPTLTARFDTEPLPLLLQLDWRIRAAGNAMPKDGLALTLSTGF